MPLASSLGMLMASRRASLLALSDLNVSCDADGYFLDPVTAQVIGGFGANDIPRGGKNFAGIFASRLNKLDRSQEQNSGSWTTANATVTENFSAAPDGTTTAAKIASTGAGGRCYQRAANSQTNYFQRIWIKQATGKYAQFRFYHDGATEWSCMVLNRQDGSVEGTAKGAGVTANSTVQVSPLVGGGYFVDYSQVWDSADETTTSVCPCPQSPSRVANTGAITDDTTGEYVEVWQVDSNPGELYPGPIIKTEAADVTRAADVVYWSSGDVPAAILSGSYTIPLVNFWTHAEMTGNAYLLAIDANNYARFNGTSNKFELYSGGVKKLESGAVTATRYLSSASVTFNLGTGDTTVAGFASGDGTNAGTATSWSAGNVYFGSDHAGANQFDGLLGEPYA